MCRAIHSWLGEYRGLLAKRCCRILVGNRARMEAHRWVRSRECSSHVERGHQSYEPVKRYINSLRYLSELWIAKEFTFAVPCFWIWWNIVPSVAEVTLSGGRTWRLKFWGRALVLFISCMSVFFPNPDSGSSEGTRRYTLLRFPYLIEIWIWPKDEISKTRKSGDVLALVELRQATTRSPFISHHLDISCSHESDPTTSITSFMRMGSRWEEQRSPSLRSLIAAKMFLLSVVVVMFMLRLCPSATSVIRIRPNETITW